MGLLEKKMLIETPLQICAFNYETGNVEQDIKKYWSCVFGEENIPSTLENHFKKYLKYYYYLYADHKSNLPRDNKVLFIFLKELMIKKIIINLSDGITYTAFCNKVKSIFEESQIKISYQRDLDDLRDDYKYLKRYYIKLKPIEKFLDLTIEMLAEKIGLENTYPLQKVKFVDFSVEKKETKKEIQEVQQENIALLSLKKEKETLLEQVEYLKKCNMDLVNRLNTEKEKNIKSIIENLDSEELEYPLGNLYLLCTSSKLDAKKIKGYLNNFFIGLEKNGIIPYALKELNKQLDIKDEDICYKYRINCDISKTKSKKGKYVLPGWQFDYKDIVLPLVEVEKEMEEGDEE